MKKSIMVFSLLPAIIFANQTNFKKTDVEKKVYVQPVSTSRVYVENIKTPHDGKLVVKNNIVLITAKQKQRNEQDIKMLKMVLKDAKTIKDKEFDYDAFKNSINEMIEALKIYK